MVAYEVKICAFSLKRLRLKLQKYSLEFIMQDAQDVISSKEDKEKVWKAEPFFL